MESYLHVLAIIGTFPYRTCTQPDINNEVDVWCLIKMRLEDHDFSARYDGVNTGFASRTNNSYLETTPQSS